MRIFLASCGYSRRTWREIRRIFMQRKTGISGRVFKKAEPDFVDIATLQKGMGCDIITGHGKIQDIVIDLTY